MKTENVVNDIILFVTILLFMGAAQARGDDFTFSILGSSHVVVGYTNFLELSRGALPNENFQATFTITLPTGVSWHWPWLTGTSQLSCSPAVGQSQTCLTVGAASLNPVILLAADATAVPGTYTVPVTATAGGISHTVNYTLKVDPTPPAWTPPNWGTPPPIPELALWQQQMALGGPVNQRYCQEQAILANSTYTGYSVTLSNVWYYDGIRVYSQMADYTGDDSWRTCAGYVSEMYRDITVIPAQGKIQGYYVFPRGLRMDYQRTKDAKSLTAVELLAENDSYLGGSLPLDPTAMRETSYAGEAGVEAYLLGDPVMLVGDPLDPAVPPRWKDNIDNLLSQFDQTLDGGSWGSVYIESFMVGLAFESLIQYYDQTKDPRIPPAVQKMADWLWANAWAPSANSFVYDTLSGPDPAMENLNPLIAPAYAWLWAMTGDPKYQQEGDTIFADGVLLGGQEIGDGKQFSQSYRWSFDYVKWRQHPESAWAAPTAISNVASQVNSTSVTITWQTNNPADSSVDYGTSLAYGQTTPVSGTLSTNHSVTLTNLSLQTTYYFVVQSRDGWGQRAALGGYSFLITGQVVVGNVTSVWVAPSSVTLTPGQTQQFSAGTIGMNNVSITWTTTGLSAGTLTPAGLYTAPSTVSSPQTVMITATSVADPTKSNSAIITVIPLVPGVVPVSITLSPMSATLQANQTQQFTPFVTGTANQAVQWSLSPPAGTISSSGLYTAPANVTATPSVTITATSVSDPTESVSVPVTLVVSDLGPPTSNPPIATVTPAEQNVRVYPNPWRSDKHAARPVINFAGLTTGMTVTLFTVSGHDVKELHSNGSTATWDLSNDVGDKVASGIYLYSISGGTEGSLKGKVAIIR